MYALLDSWDWHGCVPKEQGALRRGLEKEARERAGGDLVPLGKLCDRLVVTPDGQLPEEVHAGLGRAYVEHARQLPCRLHECCLALSIERTHSTNVAREVLFRHKLR
jgi:hypothetical protein